MKCDECCDLLSEYQAGELTGEPAEAVAVHLADCKTCTAELESYENIAKRAEELKMVKVDKIDYITIVDGVVAKK